VSPWLGRTLTPREPTRPGALRRARSARRDPTRIATRRDAGAYNRLVARTWTPTARVLPERMGAGARA